MTKRNILPLGARSYNNAYVVDVTPELAKSWLECNNFNRPCRPGVVAKYVRQIQKGYWKRTHQGIALTKEGALLDGQHRLQAVVQTGATVPMLVFTNESPESYQFIDCGLNRSNLDMIRLGQRDNTLDTKHRQTLENFLAGRTCRIKGRWSHAELNDAFRKYGPSIRFAVDLFQGCSNRWVNDPTVRGLIARAQYHVPDDRLVDFVAQLTKGGDFSSITSFRQALNAWPGRPENTRREIYRMGQRTLITFLHGKENVNKFDFNSELFPLPEVDDENRV